MYKARRAPKLKEAVQSKKSGGRVDCKTKMHVLRLTDLRNSVWSAEQQKEDTYCFCNYGESGTMLCFEKCDVWFHD